MVQWCAFKGAAAHVFHVSGVRLKQTFPLPQSSSF
jgi:hypothetical protein